MGKGCKILFNDCDPEQSKDKSLPYNTYLIEYPERWYDSF